MIRRTMDATFLNEVCNHPEVRPFLGGEGAVNLTVLAQDPANILIETVGGGWLLQAILPGVYELHTMFLPEARGRSYFAVAKEALRYVFTHTDALEIVTKCPDDNGAARMAAQLVGFRERFRRENAWTPGVGISYQALTVDDWTMRDPEVLKAGRAFHEALEGAKTAQATTLPAHPEDAAHDRFSGAAYLMAQAGQTSKAVGTYNRWALLAGYATIAATSQNVLDIGDAIVEVRDGQMHILLLRGQSGK